MSTVVVDKGEEIIYFGWLWKKGSGFISSWRRRYFELSTSGTLSYYTDEDKKISKGRIVLVNIRAYILPSSNPNPKCVKLTKPFALYLYTKGRTYQLEYGGDDTNSETAKGYLQQWFTHILYASGREEKEQLSATKIQKIFRRYCSTSTVDLVPPSTASTKKKNTNRGKSKSKTFTKHRPISQEEKTFRSATNLEWETQGKLLLLRPRTGANSILRRSPSVRNRGLCWQVLLQCLTYKADSSPSSSPSSSSFKGGTVSSASTAIKWVKIARKAKTSYQEALTEPTEPTEPTESKKTIKTEKTEKTKKSTLVPSTGVHPSNLLFDAEDADTLSKEANRSSISLRVLSLERKPTSICPLSSIDLSHEQEIIALKEEIHNDVERTFPEDPFFQDPHIKSTMERLLYTWTKQNEKNRTISYRQGMNSLLAVLLFVHKRDATAKARSLRIHLTKKLDVSLINVLHAEYLRTKESPTSHNNAQRPVLRGWLKKPDFKRKDQLHPEDHDYSGDGVNRTLAVVNETIKGDSFNKRWFVLDPIGKTLSYYKRPSDEVITEKTKNKSKKAAIRIIDLSKVTRIRMSTVNDAPDATSTFDLITHDRLYTLSAANPSIMAQWVDAIITSICDLPTASRSAHLDWTSPNSGTSGGGGGGNRRTKKNDDSKIRSSLLVLESLEMVESQTYAAFCSLMNTNKPSAVGNLAIVDLFDHYTEFDERRKKTGISRFEATARRTFLADAAVQESKHADWLAIRKLAEHMQHVLLKSVDPELYRCMSQRSIQPQLYALKWMRCLFSNVLTAEGHENFGDSNEKSKFVMDATPCSTLVHVIAVWDAMLGCRERMFDFIEAMCISMLISMRTSLLNSDENGMLALLMKYNMTSVTEMKKNCSDGRTLANHNIVQGLISMALELMEHPSWSTGLHKIHLNEIMQHVWDAPIDLTSSTEKLRRQHSNEKKKEKVNVEQDLDDLSSSEISKNRRKSTKVRWISRKNTFGEIIPLENEEGVGEVQELKDIKIKGKEEGERNGEGGRKKMEKMEKMERNGCSEMQ
jgi:hypothetical protein